MIDINRIPLPILAAGAFSIAFGGFAIAPSLAAVIHQHPTRCEIKGNISAYSGERIYHMPGGKYYDATVIAPSRGERWFCTEGEAQAAGWRRSKL